MAPIPQAPIDRNRTLSFCLNHTTSPTRAIIPLIMNIIAILTGSGRTGTKIIANRMKLIKISTDATIPITLIPTTDSAFPLFLGAGCAPCLCGLPCAQ